MPPFEGTGVDVARANMGTATPPMGIRAPGVRVEPALEALVRKLLSKDPDDRLPTARSVRELLDLFSRDRESAAALLGLRTRPVQRVVEPAPAPAPEPEELPPRRRRGPLVVAALLGAAVFGAGIYAAMKPPPPAKVVTADDTPATADADARAAGSRETPAGDVPEVATAPAIAGVPDGPDVDGTPAPARGREVPARRAAPPPPVPRPPPAGGEARASRSTVVASANTTDRVIDLYQRVGRELRAYSQIHRDDAQELWARYRWIRIHDAMTRPDKRDETMQILERLHARVSDPGRE